MANKLEQTLENISKGFVKVFEGIDKAAVIAEPFVDIAFPPLAPIYNAAANGAAAAIKAGQGAYNPQASDTDNLLAIALAVEPLLVQYAQQAGLSAPTMTTVLQYAAALQKSLAAAK
jgi:hypothetical protein